MTRDRFLTFAIRPNVMATAVPQKTPAAFCQPFFQLAALHFASVHLSVFRLLKEEHLRIHHVDRRPRRVRHDLVEDVAKL